MSGESLSAARLFTLLEPAPVVSDVPRRPEDSRLADIIVPWHSQPIALAGRTVLVGFPQDEGVRRNFGRAGAAAAPNEIRKRLYRLIPYDANSGTDLTTLPPVDLGNLRIGGSLEESQEHLAEIVCFCLRGGAVPILLGGGHETAWGHILGYLQAGKPCGVINCDAHLDVRHLVDGRGHSGSSFRQALEHPAQPLRTGGYVCLGAQPQAISRAHLAFVVGCGGVVHWCEAVRGRLTQQLIRECDRIGVTGCQAYVSVDADVVCQADVPGVSAPNPSGLAGWEVLAAIRQAGQHPAVASLDLVEINPSFDRDGQSAHWAALVIWNFLLGVAGRY